MALFDRVASSPGICGVEIDFDGYTIPSTITGFQPFNNSIPVNANFLKAYYGKASVSYSETSDKDLSGTFYTQKVTFRFPSTDKDKATRVEMFKNLKYVKLILTNGLSLVVGRNDYKQNVRPDIKVLSNEKFSQVEITNKSIFSAGFIPSASQFGLPAFIPVSLLNIN